MEIVTGWFGNHFGVMALRIILAVILCGLIGFEREMKNHSAGFRTHILVGVGSCLMMLLSLFGFDQYLDKTDTIRFDPARIPSYVISGIGFLGAGTIMVHGITIKGLTTAASIWIVAGIGLVVGVGMYSIAVLTTIIVLLSLIFLNHFEEKITKSNRDMKIRLVLQKEANLKDVLDVFDRLNISIRKMEIEKETAEERYLYIEIEKGQKEFNRNELIDFITQMEHITYIAQKN
jgi:putative Mg2+ transporter-C (MgtC) family protein